MVFYSYAETKQAQVDGQCYSSPPHPLHTEHPSRVLLLPADSSLKGRKDISNDVWNDEGSVQSKQRIMEKSNSRFHHWNQKFNDFNPLV